MKKTTFFLTLTITAISIGAYAQDFFSPSSVRHHEDKWEVWCALASSTEESVQKLNQMLANPGHDLRVRHHIEIKSVSAPMITIDQHQALHHNVKTCATVQFGEDHRAL